MVNRDSGDLRLPWWMRVAGLALAVLVLIITLPMHLILSARDAIHERIRR